MLKLLVMALVLACPALAQNNQEAAECLTGDWDTEVTRPPGTEVKICLESARPLDAGADLIRSFRFRRSQSESGSWDPVPGLVSVPISACLFTAEEGTMQCMAKITPSRTYLYRITTIWRELNPNGTTYTSHETPSGPGIRINIDANAPASSLRVQRPDPAGVL